MNFEALVAAEATGYAAPTEIAALEADRLGWATTLRRLLIETDEALKSAAHITGDERLQVLNDLTEERAHLADALRRLTGEDIDRRHESSVEEELAEPAPGGLHACWT